MQRCVFVFVVVALFGFCVGASGSAQAQTNGVSSSAPNTIGMWSNSVERLHIDSSGNVGIGTLTPLSLLHVNGVEIVGLNGGTGGQITLNGSTSGSAALRVAAAAGTGTVFQLPATNGSSGNVLQTDGTGVTSWVPASGGPAFGTLTTGDFCLATSGTAISCTTAAVSLSTQVSGTLQAAQEPAHTGDVTNPAGSLALTVAQIQGTTVSGVTGSGNVVFSASPTFTGTITGAAETLSGTVTAASFAGNVPVTDLNSGSGASSATFWRGDGNWATPTATPDSGTLCGVFTMSYSSANHNVGGSIIANCLSGITKPSTCTTSQSGCTGATCPSGYTVVPITTAGNCANTSGNNTCSCAHN